MQVLLILYPGCIYYEVATAVALLSDYQAELVSTSFKKEVKTGEGLNIQIDKEFKDVNPQEYQYILVPGGDCESVMGNEDLIALLKNTQVSQTIVAAICNGALVIAQSGLLEQKKCTHTACLKYADPDEFAELLAVANPLFEHTQYIDEHVVIDQNIITAKPWAHIEFAVTIAQLGGLISKEKVPSMMEYYRGQIKP